jgi:hypothetical protein
MNKNTKAIFILRYEDLTKDSVLAAYNSMGEISSQWLEDDVYLSKDRFIKILQISRLMVQHGYLKDSVNGYKITRKGKIHLIKISPYWNFYAVIAAILAIAISILLAVLKK